MREETFKGYKDYPVRIYIYDEVENPKGVVQIVHGMAEHARRYEHFAKVLNGCGYIVVADDHRAHGRTANTLGVQEAGDCFDDTVMDLVKLGQAMKERYQLPLYLFGHSYGSFLTQSYIQYSSDIITAVVLCGSARKNTAEIKAGKAVAACLYKLQGAHKPSKAMEGMTFGAYDMKFRKERLSGSWMCSDRSVVEKFHKDELAGQTMSNGFYLSFFRGLDRIYRKENISKIRKELPILIISGDKDAVGKFGKQVSKLYDMYVDAAINSVSLKLYKDVRHELINEVNKEEVMRDVIDFYDLWGSKI